MQQPAFRATEQPKEDFAKAYLFALVVPWFSGGEVMQKSRKIGSSPIGNNPHCISGENIGKLSPEYSLKQRFSLYCKNRCKPDFNTERWVVHQSSLGEDCM